MSKLYTALKVIEALIGIVWLVLLFIAVDSQDLCATLMYIFFLSTMLFNNK